MPRKRLPKTSHPYLVEANILGLLAETLTAEIEAILPDETGPVLADTAVEKPSR
jgi:hypothetical protein